MKDNVRILPGLVAVSAAAIVECAKQADYDEVIVIGWKDGDLYFSSSYEMNRDILWDLKAVELELFS